MRIAPPPPRREGEHVDAQLLLIGGASALIALPAVALAQTDEPVPETDPAAEEVVGKTTDKALHSEGTGGFRYEGWEA